MKNCLVLMVVLVAVLASACGGELRPAPLEGSPSCANCRMSVSDVHFAGQIVAPGEEPRFYDDLGCLSSALKGGSLPEGASAFVADHRTAEWVKADAAVYTRVESLSTPMGSNLVAHADAASRDQDAAVKGGTAVPAAEVLGRSPGDAK